MNVVIFRERRGTRFASSRIAVTRALRAYCLLTSCLQVTRSPSQAQIPLRPGGKKNKPSVIPVFPIVWTTQGSGVIKPLLPGCPAHRRRLANLPCVKRGGSLTFGPGTQPLGRGRGGGWDQAEQPLASTSRYLFRSPLGVGTSVGLETSLSGILG